MNVILYPNNEVTLETDPVSSVGTNETFSIPAVRKAIHPKGKDDVEVFTVNGHTIKAYYTHIDKKSRAEYQKEYQKGYNVEYLRMIKQAQECGKIRMELIQQKKQLLCIKAKARRVWKDRTTIAINNVLQGV